MSFQGKRNVYLCESCGLGMVTLDVDEGVTPMMTSCRVTPECRGPAVSFFYKVPQDWMKTHAYEWYRPSPRETVELTAPKPGLRDHIDQDGLLLRKKGE